MDAGSTSALHTATKVQVVEDLARHLQDCLAALYDIHTILRQHTAKIGWIDGPNAFQKNHTTFVSFCQKFVDILQRCYAVSGDHITLLDAICEGQMPASQIETFSREVVLHTQKVIGELESLAGEPVQFIQFFQRVLDQGALPSTPDNSFGGSKSDFVQVLELSQTVVRSMQAFQDSLEQLNGFCRITESQLKWVSSNSTIKLPCEMAQALRAEWVSFKGTSLESILAVRKACDVFASIPKPEDALYIRDKCRVMKPEPARLSWWNPLMFLSGTVMLIKLLLLR